MLLKFVSVGRLRALYEGLFVVKLHITSGDRRHPV